jgi:hypothetical protein
VYVATKGTEVLTAAGLYTPQHTTTQSISRIILLFSKKPIEIYFQSNSSAWFSQDYVISHGTFFVRNKDKDKVIRVHAVTE